MNCSRKLRLKAEPDGKTPAMTNKASQVRKLNHLKDGVYREMLLLEANRPGAEMGLALALLRAIVQSGSLPEQREFREWLKTICPVGLRMIEIALDRGRGCDLSAT
jgi:hypothetical protein